ncbi:MAG: RsmD family RNA methyltransferase [Acidobacteria bacterium]|nr:RsmD family RNA methyltransferase [Acidobacteriota bacterium]
MIRITGGEFRGRRIRVPGGIRPTSELVRKAFFDILGDRVENARFLDAAAGSGAVGIEAVSRGASSAVFIEKNRLVRAVLAANIESLGLGAVTSVVAGDVLAGEIPLPTGDVFDVVYLDLPYDLDSGPAVARLAPRLRPGTGLLVVETGAEQCPGGPSRQGGEEPGIRALETRRYGATSLAFFAG